MTWKSRFGVGPVAIGAGDVNDNLRVVIGRGGFEEDGAVGVEGLVGDVGQDGGASGGDAAFGDEGEEAGEKLADVRAGGELGEFGEEVGGEVGEIALVLLAGGPQGGTHREVVKTKTEMGIGGVFAAAFAVGEEMPWMAGAEPLAMLPTGSPRCSGQAGQVGVKRSHLLM